uniref:E3 UFM1-protein ligase 1 homolog n=1 Tax=Scapholeberis mucronata TaxID=202097 RepID=A0A4Y7NJQ7_9CRUS|nr:EOG090X0267 [Scapholeberis mucronata]SVE93481.1 EOG090X0267 [Scapholeberis mucronata]
MASSDWLEVQKLAAEFQRAQLSSALQKLSEKNCVEIVSKLIALKLIDVIYTTDGKEYITLDQLSNEIRGELYDHEGRISLTELAPILNVSYEAVESRAQDLAQNNSDVHLVSGQLLDNHHLDRIAEEINENLQQNGQIAIVELTKHYGLPLDFLQQLDFKFYIYNSSIIQILAFTDELINTKRIEGSITGGRQANVATFIPDVYSRSQTEWIDSFLKQNGYLEYAALNRLGISDPKAFCRKRCKDLLYLSSCCVGTNILEQIEASIEEALDSQTWVEILPLLPSVFDEEDAEQVIQNVLKNSPSLMNKDALVIGRSSVTSNAFVKSLTTLFDPLIEEKAKEVRELDGRVVTSGAYLQAQADQRNAKTKSIKSDKVSDKKDKKEERRKKANEGKVGGGVQGRETKTRSTKKKYLKGRNDSDDENDEEFSTTVSTAAELEFMSIEDISKMLRKQADFTDAADEFVDDGEKALQHFASLDLQQQLSRHLLKTCGSELINELVCYVAQDSSSANDPAELSVDSRQKLINGLPQQLRTPLQALHKATLGANVPEFLSEVETALSACDVVLRKVDKKKEKSAAGQQRTALIEQLNSASDAALVLHVASLLLFHTVTQTVLNASGRFVPQIITFLQPHLPEASADLLSTLQALVIQELTSKGDEELLKEVREKMESLIPRVREIAVTYKKSTATIQD